MKKSIVVALVITVFLIGGGYFMLRTKPPILVGYIGSLSGKYTDLGKTCRDGAILAMEKLNAQGGVNSRMLRLDIANDKSLADETLVVARKLAAAGVRAIVGPLSSTSAKAILPLVNKEKIVTVGPVVAGDYMAGKDDFFIKVYPSTTRFGEALAELAVSEEGLSRLAVVHDSSNPAYGAPIARSFKGKVEELGKTVAGVFQFDSQASFSYAEIAREILAANPEGLLFVSSPLDTAMISQQIRLAGGNISLFSSSWAASEELISGGGNAVEGILFYLPFDGTSSHPPYVEFRQRYSERFAADPTFCSAFNYDSVMLLADALERSKTTANTELRDLVLSGSPYQGVQGRYEIDANGDARRKLILQTVKNGQFTPLDRQ